MGKGARKRQRKAATAARPNKAARRTYVEAAIEAGRQRVRQLTDETVSADVAVKELFSYLVDPAPPDLARLVFAKSSRERLADMEVAAVAMGNRAALIFAADLALYDGRLVECEDRLAAVPNPDADTTKLLAGVRIDRGRLLQALTSVESLCKADPSDRAFHDLYAEIVEEIDVRTSTKPIEECGCGSGLRYAKCCREGDVAALERFTNTDDERELREAAAGYLMRDDLAEHREKTLFDWFEEPLDPGEDWAALLKEAPLIAERCWLGAPIGESEDDEDRDEDFVLGRLALDAVTDPAIARRAGEVRENAIWGLWQVDDPRTEPGVWLTNILTSVQRYVYLGDAASVARWTVLLGAIYPVDGIWRASEHLLPLSPWEGQTTAASTIAMVETVMHALAHERGKRSKIPDLLPDPTLPFAVVAGNADPIDPGGSRIFSSVTGSGLPRLLDDVLASRDRLPTLANTDGEPIELITARIRVRNLDAVRPRLVATGDFEDSGDTITWLGREMTPVEAAGSMAEYKAFAAREGLELTEVDPSEPRRFLRAALEIEDGVIRAEVNSRERFQRLIAILREVGAEPEVDSEFRMDPAMDFPSPREVVPHTGPGMSHEAHDAWAKAWLDEPVPALGGLTPREAREDSMAIMRLEFLLRDFEHRGDIMVSRGSAGPDVDWLREELDLRVY